VELSPYLQAHSWIVTYSASPKMLYTFNKDYDFAGDTIDVLIMLTENDKIYTINSSVEARSSGPYVYKEGMATTLPEAITVIEGLCRKFDNRYEQSIHDTAFYPHEVDAIGYPLDPEMRGLQAYLATLAAMYRGAHRTNNQVEQRDIVQKYYTTLHKLYMLGWDDGLDREAELPGELMPEEYFKRAERRRSLTKQQLKRSQNN
jgi:hypothetical protein